MYMFLKEERPEMDGFEKEEKKPLDVSTSTDFMASTNSKASTDVLASADYKTSSDCIDGLNDIYGHLGIDVSTSWHLQRTSWDRRTSLGGPPRFIGGEYSC